MPAKNKKHQEQRRTSEEDKESSNDSDVQSEKIVSKNKEGNLQISAAEAQQYFQYLRKKISNQNNDPFSLPFLNLKFQQLQSWKGATQQLNLESRIYGMRVDNCHDYTMKMLNYVIRNQQEQIKQQDDMLKNQQKRFKNEKQEINYHLQKPQRLITNIEMDKNIKNHNIWKVIFKKSENSSQLQLNTLELSNQLALVIDQRKISYRGDNQSKRIQKQTNIFTQQKFNEMCQVFQKISPNMLIFNEIIQFNKQLETDLQNILQRYKNQNDEQSFQNVRLGDDFGLNNSDFIQFWQQFNHSRTGNSQQLRTGNSQYVEDEQNFQLEDRFNILSSPGRDLFSIPLQNISQPIMANQQQYDDSYQWDNEQTDQYNLYQPNGAMLYFQKLNKQRQNPRFKQRRIRTRKIDKVKFDTKIIQNRQKVFSDRFLNSRRPKFNNENLIPINYSLLFQCRNPFRKMKKVDINPGIRRQTISQFEQTNQINYQNQYSLQNNPNPFGLQTQFNSFNVNPLQDRQLIQNNGLKNYRHTSIKAVKNQIKNQLLNDESFIASRMLSNPHYSQSMKFNQFDSNRDPQFHVSFNFLKQKMKNCDPLDILVSMLHIAYQEQVKLQPIYESNYHQQIFENSAKLNDIVINAEDYFQI